MEVKRIQVIIRGVKNEVLKALYDGEGQSLASGPAAAHNAETVRELCGVLHPTEAPETDAVAAAQIESLEVEKKALAARVASTQAQLEATAGELKDALAAKTIAESKAIVPDLSEELADALRRAKQLEGKVDELEKALAEAQAVPEAVSEETSTAKERPATKKKTPSTRKKSGGAKKTTRSRKKKSEE